MAALAQVLGFFAVCGAILFIGWNEPLKYRFMSEADIHAIEHPATPEPAVTPQPATPAGAWMHERRPGSRLDSGPVKDGFRR